MYLKAFSGILKSKKVPEIFWYLLWFVNNKDYAQSICSTLKCIPHSLFAEFPNCILRWNPLILDSFCNDIFPCSSTVYLSSAWISLLVFFVLFRFFIFGNLFLLGLAESHLTDIVNPPKKLFFGYLINLQN